MRKKEQTIIVISVLITIGLVLFSWLWLVPHNERLNAEKEQRQLERETYDNQVQLLTVARDQIRQAGSGASGSLPVSLSDLKKVLPEAQELEDWYAMIENMARGAQLSDPVNVTIGQAGPTEVAEVAVDVTANGPYENIVSFIVAFQEALRPINVTAVELTPRDEGGMTASIKAIAYVRGDAAALATTPVVTGEEAISGLEATANFNPAFTNQPQ